MEREWTEWTSALAVAEGLTDWEVDRHPARWAGAVDRRPAVMVLLAYAIQATARDRGVRSSHPDQLGPLSLRLVGERLTVERAHTLLHTGDGLGPVDEQIGADYIRDVVQVSDQPDQEEWRQVVRRAADVVAEHVAAARSQESPIAGRRIALAANARRRTLEQLRDVFGDDDY